MNFDNEVGKTFTLIVNSYRLKDGGEKIGFEPKFHDFDTRIYEAVQATKTQDEIEKEEDARMWNMLDDELYGVRSYGRRREIGPHASMHIFHLSGNDNPELIVGDAWEVEVVKCYAATRSIKRNGRPDDVEWTEPKTKDGRTKIHYTVRPRERLLTVKRGIDWSGKRLCIDKSCGRNQSDEFIPLDKVADGAFRYTDSLAGNWVVFGLVGYLNGKVEGVVAQSVKTSNQWMNGENFRLGGRIETKRLKALWRALPEAPHELWDEVVKNNLCDSALRRTSVTY